jgi:hypothetical protein
MFVPSEASVQMKSKVFDTFCFWEWLGKSKVIAAFNYVTKHNTSQYPLLEYLYFVYVARGCTSPELDATRPDGFQNFFV